MECLAAADACLALMHGYIQSGCLGTCFEEEVDEEEDVDPEEEEECDVVGPVVDTLEESFSTRLGWA